MTLSPGTRLGPYQIIASLGAGGMGEVYKALDTRLDRTVAIKVMGAALTPLDDGGELEREARAVAARSAAGARSGALHDSDRRSARPRASSRRGASRSQAGQHHDHALGREGARLRPGDAAS